MDIKQLGAKFNALPPAGKVGLAGAAGLALYWLFGRAGAANSTEETAVTASDGLIIYPMAAGAADSSGGEYYDSYSAPSGSGNINSNTTYEQPDYDDTPAIDWQQVQTYVQEPEPQIYAAPVIENMAATAGGNTLSLNTQLQQAQADYGAATTAAERAAAAAKGQELRAAGATDEGAQAVWQSLRGGVSLPAQATNKSSQSTSSNSSLTANEKLQQAQAAYGAAKTAAERKAAAAAGAAARAAGATEAGAQDVWKKKAAK